MSKNKLIGILFFATGAIAQQSDSIQKNNWIKGLTQQQPNDVEFHFRDATAIDRNKIRNQKPGVFSLSKQELQVLNFYDTYTFFNEPINAFDQESNYFFKQHFNDYFYHYINPFVISPLQKIEFRNIP
jgi:hypothetical protein